MSEAKTETHPDVFAEASFLDWPLRDTLLEDIRAAGWTRPTPIQAACITHALEGRDVIGLAQTGTGKTGAFALPIIHRLGNCLEMKALIVAPVRELAQQIAEMFEQLGKTTGIRTAVVVGGIPMDKDLTALRRWPNVLIATPGRLIDHIRCGSVILTDIEMVVLDEADRMHDMGFIPQIRQIIRALPEKRQTLLFTATMDPDIEQIARRNMTDPVRIQIGRTSSPADGARQVLYKVKEEKKSRLLSHLIEGTDGRVLVFVRTKRGVDRLAGVVRKKFRRVERLHSNRSQAERNTAMAAFKEGKSRILIATDIAARGIDVADIEHVINYDFPLAAEDYVHRIGRTARVAATGDATTFVTRADRHYLRKLEELLGRKFQLKPDPFAKGEEDDDERDEDGPHHRLRRRPKSKGRRRGRSRTASSGSKAAS